MNALRLCMAIAGGLWLASTSSLHSQTQGCLAPPPGLVSWWRAEGNGVDAVGTNDATLVGGVTFTTGMVGSGFLISGSGDDYVRLPQNLFPYPASGNGNAPFSFEVWFKTTAGGVILGQQDVPPFGNPFVGNVPALYVGTNGSLHAAMFWDAGLLILSLANVADGIFHHTAVTFDGHNETLFLDGAALFTTPFVQQAYATNYEYQLGTGYTPGWTNTPGIWFPFSGVIDEASLYNRALSASEVTALYTAGSAGKCVPFHPLLHAVRSGADVVLSWSAADSTGFQLQAASSLRSPNWLAVTNAVTLTNSVYRARVPMSSAAAFYQLKK